MTNRLANQEEIVPFWQCDIVVNNCARNGIIITTTSSFIKYAGVDSFRNNNECEFRHFVAIATLEDVLDFLYFNLLNMLNLSITDACEIKKQSILLMNKMLAN